MSDTMLCAVTDDPSYDASDFYENKGYYKVKQEEDPRLSLNLSLAQLMASCDTSIDEKGTIHIDWSKL